MGRLTYARAHQTNNQWSSENEEIITRLAPVYVVGILDFAMDDSERRASDIITKVQLKDGRNEVFNENLNFIFIEMPKFRKEESELDTFMDKWLYAIKNLGKLDDKPAALTEAIFKRFFEVAEIAAFSKTERYDYEENLKNYTDWFNVLNTAKKEGLAEGEAALRFANASASPGCCHGRLNAPTPNISAPFQQKVCQ